MQSIQNAIYLIIDNPQYFGILLLIFLSIVLLFVALGFFLSSDSGGIRKRLKKMVGPPGKPVTEAERPKFINQESTTLASRLSRPLHKLSALDERSKRNKLRLKLVRAGYRSDNALHNYLALKIILGVVMVVGFIMSKIFYSLDSQALLKVFCYAILGFFVPNIWLWLATKARQEKITKGLPDALDLMVVCVEAGLGLDATFKRVGEEMASLCKEISEEFNLTNLEIRAGIARDEAFKNMSIRTGVAEVNSLMTVLNQTSRFGTSIAAALRVHADAMRVKRRQLAEEVAAKSSVKLVFPLVLFIFPAIFVVIIGSGAIRIIKYLLPALGG